MKQQQLDMLPFDAILLSLNHVHARRAAISMSINSEVETSVKITECTTRSSLSTFFPMMHPYIAIIFYICIIFMCIRMHNAAAMSSGLCLENNMIMIIYTGNMKRPIIQHYEQSKAKET